MSSGSSRYSRSFYERQQAGSYRSAKQVLPVVFAEVRPGSIVDVGCGVGTWLHAAREIGAERTVGIEGPWVRDVAKYPALEIVTAEIEEALDISETFDLAICMEVAEHISESRAAGLVQDLTRLAPNVLFSAAIPRQGGNHHINEQWQSYWGKLFAQHGYGARDIVRPTVRWRFGVEFWYRQNAILYSRGTPVVSPASLDQVHPYQRIAWGWKAATGVVAASLARLRADGETGLRNN